MFLQHCGNILATSFLLQHDSSPVHQMRSSLVWKNWTGAHGALTTMSSNTFGMTGTPTEIQALSPNVLGGQTCVNGAKEVEVSIKQHIEVPCISSVCAPVNAFSSATERCSGK